MSWNDAWATLNSSGLLEERVQQRTLAEAVFSVTENGGTLIGEAGTGTGKSFAYLIPLIWRVRDGHRGVVSTETTALQDQLVDKDLPFLKEKFGGFKFRSLKGRSWYLCRNRAPKDHGVLLRLGKRDLADGERRDVERVLGYRLDDSDWELLSGESDFCAQAKCAPEVCYSSRARKLALEADIVVCNHALLRTHAEMAGDSNGTNDGILGDFKHLVVDEAHTLEKVLVDGWAEELSPWHRYKALQAINTGVDAATLGRVLGGKLEEAERLFKEGIDSIVKLHTRLLEKQKGYKPTEFEWRRQNIALAQVYLSGPQDPDVIVALEEYELLGPGRFKAASDLFGDIAKKLRDELEVMERGTRKVRKGMNAAKKVSKLSKMMAEAMDTRDGIVLDYGVPYAVIADGWKAWKGDYDVRLRAVPLDVSTRARETIWADPKSVTLVSATLSDSVQGDFTYILKSLGLEQADQLLSLSVNSPFDYAKQQLVYITPESNTQVDVPGAQFSFDEMVRVLEAADGRSLVLFTARAELDYAAEELQRRGFPHQVLVQDQGANKQTLVDEFTHDKHSVLLATKSFFTGVDFPGETCSVVVLAKYPLPQYNTLCRAQVAWWRKRGYPTWYEREGTLVARQAVGRLIRTENDHGVIALLDQRTGMHDKIVSACPGSYVTKDTKDVKQWLATN